MENIFWYMYLFYIKIMYLNVVVIKKKFYNVIGFLYDLYIIYYFMKFL